jgi:hypothetical protein
MKRCTYCGKEYPDDVAACPLDQHPVTPDGREVTLPKKPRSDNREHLASRPAAVKFAVSLLAFAVVLDLALTIFKYQSNGARTRDFYPTAVFAFGTVAILLYLVFRGKNWARWVVACSISLGILIGPFRRIGPPHWEAYFFTFIDILAVVALFQSSANDWYRGTNKASTPAAA